MLEFTLHDMFLAMVNYVLHYQKVFLELQQKFLLKKDIEREDGNFTTNVVYKDILLS